LQYFKATSLIFFSLIRTLEIFSLKDEKSKHWTISFLDKDFLLCANFIANK